MSEANENLKWLEELKSKARELHEEEEAAKKTIRDGFVEQTIMFIDVVGSTAFKIANQANPEIWILRVKQFCEMIADAVKNCNGKVIKFIGDEVMAIFDNVNDAQNLLGRVAEIEESLKHGTGFETRVKIAVDFGLVYALDFKNHSVADPQGTPVDRCARIAKYGEPGEVLSSQSFAEKTTKLGWKKVGAADLRGLGRQVIYQLEHVTISLEEKIEVSKIEFDKITEERDELRTELAKLRGQNTQLQRQLMSIGQTPDPEAIVKDSPEDEWAGVKNQINILDKLIKGAPGAPNYYARFIFLYEADKGPERYNQYEGKVFDELIQSNLVVDKYPLKQPHPRLAVVSG